nr:unnamed protein product [Callosobruchus analis]
MVSTHFGFQNFTTEITPDFRLSYKNCQLYQEQRFERKGIYTTLRES